ncbi:MAG: hypothetical protein ABI120_16585, partial [Gemmatimonadaceae bacterium]
MRIFLFLVTNLMHLSVRFLQQSILTSAAVLVLPAVVCAQTRPPAPPPVRDTAAARRDSGLKVIIKAANARDTLTTAQREELRRVAREARDITRERQRNDTASRRALARAAEPSAFADSGAKQLLERARFAREAQDSALRSYSALATQRISANLGVRKVGLEKLMFRGDNVARVSWKRGVGVWVAPVGSRMVVPMADKVDGDGFTSAITIPYFPGKETLWLPDGGVA